MASSFISIRDSWHSKKKKQAQQVWPGPFCSMCVSLNPKQQEPQGVLLTSYQFQRVTHSDFVETLPAGFRKPHQWINGVKKSLSAWAWSIKKSWINQHIKLRFWKICSCQSHQQQKKRDKSCESRHLFYLWRSFHSFNTSRGHCKMEESCSTTCYPLVNSQNIRFFYLSSELQNVCSDITIHKM